MKNKLFLILLLMSNFALSQSQSFLFLTGLPTKSDNIIHPEVQVSNDEFLYINLDSYFSHQLMILKSFNDDSFQEFETLIKIENNSYLLNFKTVESFVEEYISVVAHLDNDENFPSFFTIHENQIYGDFYTPNGLYRADVIENENVFLKPAFFEKHKNKQVFDHDLNLTSTFNELGYQYTLPTYSKTQNNSVLYVGFVFTNAVGGSFNPSALSFMTNSIQAANSAFSQSNVQITLIPRFFTNLKTGIEGSFSNNVNTAQSIFSSQQLNIADPNSNNGFYVSGNKILPVIANQFVLVMGSGSGVCGKAGSSGQLSKFLTVRKATNCNMLTLAHEIGHNLTLTHSDGTYKPPVNTNGTSFPGWKSIMYDLTSYSWAYFTGGSNNSVFNTIICNGYCNSDPFASHNSITKLNNARFGAQSNWLTFPKPEDIFDIR